MSVSENLTVATVLGDEALRRRLFPVTAHRVFLAHAGVSPLCGPAAEAMVTETRRAAADLQEGADFMGVIAGMRADCAALIGAKPGEVSLLGPTTLGLNLVALGLDWQPGDEVVYYPGDYPANVYPWRVLAERGVRPVPVETQAPGAVRPEDVFAVLTPRTRLVALASCHFLTGYRLNVPAIGEELRRRGVLFCLDAIQSLGATPVDAQWVDFLSADAHKWMLGPSGAGIFYVAESAREHLRPVLVGSWNVHSPNFIAQEEVRFETGGRRYEPGSLNLIASLGMASACTLLERIGVEAIAVRLLELRHTIEEKMRAAGLEPVHAGRRDDELSGIVAAPVDPVRGEAAFKRMLAEKVSVSLRHDGAGTPHFRFSPHFYNTEAEIDQAFAVLGTVK